MNFLEKLELHLECAFFSSVGPEWDTRRFPLRSLHWPLTRLYLPVAGRGVVTQSDGTQFILEPGKLLLIPACREIHCRCDRFLEKYWIQFNALTGNGMLDIFTLYGRCLEREVNSGDMEAVIWLFKQIIKASQAAVHNDPGSDMVWRSALRILIAPFLNLAFSGETSRLPKLIEILVLLDKNLGNAGFNMSHLGRLAGMHPNYLCEYFRDMIGMGPMSYLRTRRIARALDLLRNTSSRINEIAEQTGFVNSRAFTQAFNRFVRISPREYRKNSIDLDSNGDFTAIADAAQHREREAVASRPASR